MPKRCRRLHRKHSPLPMGEVLLAVSCLLLVAAASAGWIRAW